MAFEQLSAQLGWPVWVIVILVVWTIIWKGIALWKSARNRSVIWFVVLLVINTAGILEILYIFLFSKIKLGGKKRKVKKNKRKRKR